MRYTTQDRGPLGWWVLNTASGCFVGNQHTSKEQANKQAVFLNVLHNNEKEREEVIIERLAMITGVSIVDITTAVERIKKAI